MKKKFKHIRKTEQGYKARVGHTTFDLVYESKWYLIYQGRKSKNGYNSPQEAIVAYVIHLNKCSEYEAIIHCNNVWRGTLEPLLPGTAISDQKQKAKKQQVGAGAGLPLPQLPIGSKWSVQQRGRIKGSKAWHPHTNARVRKHQLDLHESGLFDNWQAKPKERYVEKQLPEQKEKPMREGEVRLNMYVPKRKYTQANEKHWRVE